MFSSVPRVCSPMSLTVTPSTSSTPTMRAVRSAAGGPRDVDEVAGDLAVRIPAERRGASGDEMLRTRTSVLLSGGATQHGGRPCRDGEDGATGGDGDQPLLLLRALDDLRIRDRGERHHLVARQVGAGEDLLQAVLELLRGQERPWSRPCRASRRSSPSPAGRSPRRCGAVAPGTSAARASSRHRPRLRQRSSSTTSSKPQFAPWPKNGRIAWAASPTRPTLPSACQGSEWIVASRPTGLYW